VAGMLLAVKKMDKVIEVIRRAKDPAEARAALCTEKFGLSLIQVRDEYRRSCWT